MSIQIGSDLSIPFSHSAMSIQIRTPDKVLDDDPDEFQFDLPSSSFFNLHLNKYSSNRAFLVKFF